MQPWNLNNELTQRHVANTYTIWGFGLGWALGGTSAGVVGVLVTPHYGWRSLYWIGSFSFVLIPILYLTLPESVKFLALRGRTEEIKTILTRLRPERVGQYRDSRIPVDSQATTGAATVTLLSNAIAALRFPFGPPHSFVSSAFSASQVGSRL